MKNNFILALFGGAITALISASIWAAITISTEYQIGWMAVGVGFLVGYAVRFSGRGGSALYGIIGAAFALLGCAGGNLFSGIGFIAQDEGLSYMEALLSFDYTLSIELISAMFAPMDLLFYGIALWEGYNFGIYREAE